LVLWRTTRPGVDEERRSPARCGRGWLDVPGVVRAVRPDRRGARTRQPHSAKPHPYDHSPYVQVPTPQRSQGVTDSAACSTNVSRSHEVRRVSGTHTLVHAQPNEKQVGDKGIDGLASVSTATSTSPTFPSATRVHRSALASVPDSTVVPAAAEVNRTGAFPRTGVDALAVVPTRDASAMWPGRRRCRHLDPVAGREPSGRSSRPLNSDQTSQPRVSRNPDGVARAQFRQSRSGAALPGCGAGDGH
jgi:hypothetical protein